jgi:hypothetical protein
MAHPICGHCLLPIARNEAWVKLGAKIYHARCWERQRSERERAS